MWRALCAAGLVAIAVSAIEAQGFVKWLGQAPGRIDWTTEPAVLEWWATIDHDSL